MGREEGAMTTTTEQLSGRALDAAIHRALTGECLHPRESLKPVRVGTFVVPVCSLCGVIPPKGAEDGAHIPHYSGDIAAAWQVVDWLRARFTNVSLTAANRYACIAWNISSEGEDSASVWERGDTAPEAICLAALAALEEGGKGR